jgi:hypothetical protein
MLCPRYSRMKTCVCTKKSSISVCRHVNELCKSPDVNFQRCIGLQKLQLR